MEQQIKEKREREIKVKKNTFGDFFNSNVLGGYLILGHKRRASRLGHNVEDI